MSHQQRKTKTPKQLETLLYFYHKHHMVTTKDKDKIQRCSYESGLSPNEINKWIGNHNAKLKGNRKGAKHYPPPAATGSTRQSSGYNIFQSEMIPPESLSLAEKPVWWSAQWKSLPPEKIEEYRQRAKEANLANKSEMLSGEALEKRKNFLLRKFNSCCAELGQIGIEVASILIVTRQDPCFGGTPKGISFFQERRFPSQELANEFKEFVLQANSSFQTPSRGAVNLRQIPMVGEETTEIQSEEVIPPAHFSKEGDSITAVGITMPIADWNSTTEEFQTQADSDESSDHYSDTEIMANRGRNRLTLNKKSPKSPINKAASSTASIVNLFKKQEARGASSTHEIIENKKSQYAPQSSEQNKRPKRSLSLKKSQPQQIHVEETGACSIETRDTNVDDVNTLSRTEQRESCENQSTAGHTVSDSPNSCDEVTSRDEPHQTKRKSSLKSHNEDMQTKRQKFTPRTSNRLKLNTGQGSATKTMPTETIPSEFDISLVKDEVVEISDTDGAVDLSRVKVEGNTAAGNVGDEEGEDGAPMTPYYLENFVTILTSVQADDYYVRLFNKQDCAVMADFSELSDEGQKLYVRLFQRKLRWLRPNQIQYPQIGENLEPVLRELVRKGLLIDEASLADLADALHALPAPDLRVMCKNLRLGSTDPRPALIDNVLKHARKKSIGAFFTANTQGNNEKNLLKRTLSLLGSCYKVDTERRSVFMRAMMLFSLHNITGDEDESTNNQLFQMLMTNIGQVCYPDYEVRRETQIFLDRAELLSFCSAVQLATDLREAADGNRVVEALRLYEQVKPEADQLIKDAKTTRSKSRLPEHLRWFSTGSAYVRALTSGVEALQKTRDYRLAVAQLQELLAQRTYHSDYRGRWYDRLALNLHTHLKQPQRALEVIKDGLQDPCVRVGHRLALWQRAQKLCTSPSLKTLHQHWDELKNDEMAAVKEAPKVTIEGRQLVVPGAQSTWCTDDSCVDGTGSVTFIRRVEDVALRHYANHGYPKGLHGEGGTVSALLALLLWDMLFADVPDAFINQYQSAPLDLYTDRFYNVRHKSIDSRLHWLSRASHQEIEDEIEQSWNDHEKTFCVGLNWDRFEDVSEAKGLASCIGGKNLSLIFSRMVKNLRFTRSGFPDLIVWNTDTKQFKVVEVKGPGDRLSTKQILWLDFLNNIGVSAETCYVNAVGAKKLR